MIGTKNKLFMAPMAGITDRAFREMVKKFGCDHTVTEMVSAKGLYYGDPGTKRMLDFEGEDPLIVQIFGHEVDIIKEAVKMLNDYKNILALDINMGCPAPKIFKNGDGSAIMKNPKLAGQIVKSMVENSNYPITVKMRLGVNESNETYLEVGKEAQENGASAICLHPRYRDQYYTGQADWQAIKKLASKLQIPVLGNGDIFSGQDAKNMLEYTGCSGLMVGRGALGKPYIFKEIKAYLGGKDFKEPGIQERISLLKEHYGLAKAYKPKIYLKEMRKQAAWYIKGLRGANQIKDKINKTESEDQVFKILEDFSLTFE